jgi:hypothetical protein
VAATAQASGAWCTPGSDNDFVTDAIRAATIDALCYPCVARARYSSKKLSYCDFCQIGRFPSSTSYRGALTPVGALWRLGKADTRLIAVGELDSRFKRKL